MGFRMVVVLAHIIPSVVKLVYIISDSYKMFPTSQQMYVNVLNLAIRSGSVSDVDLM